jgi:hypothetical protein
LFHSILFVLLSAFLSAFTFNQIFTLWLKFSLVTHITFKLARILSELIKLSPILKDFHFFILTD